MILNLIKMRKNFNFLMLILSFFFIVSVFLFFDFIPGLSLPNSSNMITIRYVYGYLCLFLLGIFFFVFYLYLYIILGIFFSDSFLSRIQSIYFRSFSHNTFLEFFWTTLPIFLLVFMTIPSFISLYSLEYPGFEPCITIKATGHQWYWNYEHSSLPTEKSLYIFFMNERSFLNGCVNFFEEVSFFNFFSPDFFLLKTDIDFSIEGVFFNLLVDYFYFTKDKNSQDFFFFFESYPFFCGNVFNFFFFEFLYNYYENYLNDIDKFLFWGELRFLNYFGVLKTSFSDKFLFSYIFSDLYGSKSYDSYMLDVKDLLPGTFRLLEVDQPLVLPYGVPVRLLTSSDDVIHSFAVPRLGLKMDAVPGRLNEVLFFIDSPGVYYGQCSELCGANHGFMPIKIMAVSWSDYVTWYKKIN